MAFCDNCGHELRSTAKFCGSCGTSREPTDDTPKPSRGRPTLSRKKSREEELTEYEEEYVSRSEDSESKSRSRTARSKQNVNSGNVLQRPPEWKSMGVTMVLTIVLGIIGLGGIGHLYLGKIIKGIVLIIVGIILTIFGWLTIFGLIILFIFALCVVYDAYRLCKRYNNDLEQTGRPPW